MPKDFVQIPEPLRALDWRVGELLNGEPIDPSDWLSTFVPAYSTDIEAAWEIVEHFNDLPNTEAALRTRFHGALATGDPLWALSAEQAARLLCVAALTAAGVAVPA